MTTRPARSLALLLPLVLAGASAAAELFAGQLTAENLEARRVSGPDAIGGLGDWALGNGTLCAVVSDPAHEGYLSERGGLLVDLGHCGRADDHWSALHQLVDMSRANAVRVEALRAAVAADAARLTTHGSFAGLAVETTYSLDASRPSVLRLRTVLERVEPGDGGMLFGDLVLHGNRSLAAFTLSSDAPGSAPGFHHPPADPDDVLGLVRAIRVADAQVLVGPPGSGIAYGLRRVSSRLEAPGAPPRELPPLALNGDDFTLLGLALRPFWFAPGTSLGVLQLAQLPFVDLDEGERVVIERELTVGARADVASVTDQWLGRGPRVRGRVVPADAMVHIERADGPAGPVTAVRPGTDGRFAARLDPGAHALEVRFAAGDVVRRAFTVAAGDTRLEPVVSAARAALDVPAIGPALLTLRGAVGTSDPWLGDDQLDFRVGDETHAPSAAAPVVPLAGLPDDPQRIVLPPGSYRVFVSRGPEFGLVEAAVELRAGEVRALRLVAPVRAVATPGWISADLHVHAEPSDDSTLPLRTRLASFVAQGAEVLVATDHDHVTDYGPLVRELDLASRVATLVGVEATSNAPTERAPHTFGHANVFPLPYRPRRFQAGAPRNENARLRDLIAEVRALGGERVVQVNHPRRETPGELHPQSFFSHLSVGDRGFDPALPLDAPSHRSLMEADPETGLRDVDFDAVELMNGPSLDTYRRVRSDWFALLRQGVRRTATANSDSHHLRTPVAWPRNLVRVHDGRDTVERFDAEAFVRAVREGRVVGSTGPVLGARIGDAGVGDTFHGQEGVLTVLVQAAHWVPVDTLRVYVDGRLVEERAVAAGDAVDVPLAFDGDAFVTVEVEGEVEGAYAALLPGFTPFAFTNPIFVDADGDGRWSPAP